MCPPECRSALPTLVPRCTFCGTRDPPMPSSLKPRTRADSEKLTSSACDALRRAIDRRHRFALAVFAFIMLGPGAVLYRRSGSNRGGNPVGYALFRCCMLGLQP